MRKFVVISLLGLFASKAYAYPNYISFGYASCAICHYNPQGNGILTDYGRGIAATKIASSPFTDDDEEAVKASGLMFSTPLPDWLRADLDARVLFLKKSVGQESSSFSTIPMKLDTSVVVQSASKKLYAVGNIGYYRRPDVVDETIITREHYLGWWAQDNLGVFAGYMDHAYGLRVPDHNVYSRLLTSNRQNDQTHGVMVNWGGEKAELAVHGFMGNMFQDSELRQKGFSLKGEWGITKRVRPGISFLKSQSDFRSRMLTALHTRVALREGSSLMAELGFVKEGPSDGDQELKSYALLQNNYQLVRGFSLLFTGEAFTLRTFEPSERTLRFAPGFQWFPMQRFELRGDIYFTRVLGSTAVSDDNIDMLLQAHLWM